MGVELDRVGALPWLHDTDVHYWGDLDTHGFAILDKLRAWAPRARSFLMDRKTLLAHRERWGHETSPTSARLTRLDPDESTLYVDLVTDRLGEALRLEQERIDWTWPLIRLPYSGPAGTGRSGVVTVVAGAAPSTSAAMSSSARTSRSRARATKSESEPIPGSRSSRARARRRARCLVLPRRELAGPPAAGLGR